MAVLTIKNNTNHVLATPFGPVPPQGIRSFRVVGQKAERAASILASKSDSRFVAQLEEEPKRTNTPEPSYQADEPTRDLSDLSRKELAALYKERFGKSAGRMSKTKLLEALTQ